MNTSTLRIVLSASFAVLVSAPGLRAQAAPAPVGLSPTAQDFAVSQSGGSHRDRLRRKPDLSYRQVSPSASLDERLAGWRLMRVEALDSDGWAKVGGTWIRAKSEGHYYANANAVEAEALFVRAQQVRSQGIRWVSLSPVYGAAAGGLAGGVVGLLQPAQAHLVNGELVDQGTDRTDHTFVGFALGSVGGALAGLGLGLWVESDEARQAHDLRVQAAESFNQKLWQDLRLDLVPLQGGGELDLHSKF